MAQVKDIVIPDLGGASDVEVIEVRIQQGSQIEKEDPLLTLEGDKASMDVPAAEAGTVQEVTVKEGDHVNQGDVIGKLEVADEAESGQEAEEAEEAEAERGEEEPAGETEKTESEVSSEEESESKSAEKQQETKQPEPEEEEAVDEDVHAGPAVRRMAKELGVRLSNIQGSGPKGRIVKADVQQYVKQRMSGGEPASVGAGIPEVPLEDFSQYGPVEEQELNKIKRLTGENLHRSWLNVPHVTQFDEADITEMENFRKAKKAEAEKQGIRLTPLAFVMKATVAALKAFPAVNSSLDPNEQKLILKKYYHLGVAVDTPNGLVVPVIRNVDQKGIFELAEELAEVSNKAREKGLSTQDMKGGTFTISSLGGIGGTGFTPIVNAPQVAILGVSKAVTKPVYQDNEFVPRLIMPFSLSYDHRVIDGAEGVRFTQYLASRLADIRNIIL